MTLKNSGNVGIGTSTPGARLELQGSNSGTTYSSGEQVLILRNSVNAVNARGAGIRFDSGSYNGGGAQIDLINGGTANEGHLSFGTRDAGGTMAEKMRISSAGNIGVGVVSPAYKIDVNGDIRATGFIASSDMRLKTEIRKVKGLETISRLHGYSYDWRDSGKGDFGVIAQEVEKVMPDAVVTNPETGMKAVKYNGLFAPVIESIKELYSAITGQDKKIKEQNRKIASLEKKNKELEERLKRLEESLPKQSAKK